MYCARTATFIVNKDKMNSVQKFLIQAYKTIKDIITAEGNI